MFDLTTTLKLTVWITWPWDDLFWNEILHLLSITYESFRLEIYFCLGAIWIQSYRTKLTIEYIIKVHTWRVCYTKYLLLLCHHTLHPRSHSRRHICKTPQPAPQGPAACSLNNNPCRLGISEQQRYASTQSLVGKKNFWNSSTLVAKSLFISGPSSPHGCGSELFSILNLHTRFQSECRADMFYWSF